MYRTSPSSIDTAHNDFMSHVVLAQIIELGLNLQMGPKHFPPSIISPTLPILYHIGPDSMCGRKGAGSIWYQPHSIGASPIREKRMDPA
jgi:hypothetical protein